MRTVSNESRKYTNDLALWFSDHGIDVERHGPVSLVISDADFTLLAHFSREDRQEFFALSSGVDVHVGEYKEKSPFATPITTVLDRRGKDPIGKEFHSSETDPNGRDVSFISPEVFLPGVDCVYGSPEWISHMAGIRHAHRDPIAYAEGGWNRTSRHSRTFSGFMSAKYTRPFLDKTAAAFAGQPKPSVSAEREMLYWLWANRSSLTIDELAEMVFDLPRVHRMAFLRADLDLMNEIVEHRRLQQPVSR